ncbi:capsular polysaccharide biosynthesis protein [Aestuariivirga sp.]|uniref:capsular polysaccharide biosynthesis protein n=1 Tax=Aestuariivirga sp. TaxID=2650926 RepID=UPI0039E5ACCB
MKDDHSIAIFSAGLWRLADEVQALTGMTPNRAWLSPGNALAVAGWGHKPTAHRARLAAERGRLPYVAIEDGFLRSLKPGMAQRPSALVMDRSGIYYDARQPSDLERILAGETFSADECRRAEALLGEIARLRLSKYNTGAENLESLGLPRDKPLVIVTDQTFGDQSVIGGMADGKTFEAMLNAAINENPGAGVFAKLHPETAAGTKQGYLRKLAEARNAPVIAADLCPWALFDLHPKIYTVSSQLGFEGVMAGLEVVCFGMPFYAGWGLTDDRQTSDRRKRMLSRAELAAGVYLRYSYYFDAWRRTPVSAETAVEQLGFLRRHYFSNSRPVICVGLPRWKRKAVSVLLEGPHGKPEFQGNSGKAIMAANGKGAMLAAWAPKARKLRPEARRHGITCLAIEDGFIRSAGLGAAFNPPLSLVFDDIGIYYDAAAPSRLEHILSGHDFDGMMLARARVLRERLVAERITKYNLPHGDDAQAVRSDGRQRILAIGQVGDDWAVRLGGPQEQSGNINLALLKSVRERWPEAHVIFKPHPDVERLGRAGALTAEEERRYADEIARTASLDELLARVDRLETYGSLAGFEALLRGLPVTVHGIPFYAGWGLTGDVHPAARRGIKLSLDQLVAGTLLAYPKYWDPVSGLPCPPDVVLDRIAVARSKAAEQIWRTALGRTVIAYRKVRQRMGAGQ